VLENEYDGAPDVPSDASNGNVGTPLELQSTHALDCRQYSVEVPVVTRRYTEPFGSAAVGTAVPDEIFAPDVVLK